MLNLRVPRQTVHAYQLSNGLRLELAWKVSFGIGGQLAGLSEWSRGVLEGLCRWMQCDESGVTQR
jgi:hypothetical protein